MFIHASHQNKLVLEYLTAICKHINVDHNCACEQHCKIKLHVTEIDIIEISASYLNRLPWIPHVYKLCVHVASV